MQTTIAGFTLGFSLILAIGSQNAFVLRQGLRREHVFGVCLVAAVSDAILIAIGVSSFDLVERLFPQVKPLFIYGGAAFLIWYGWLNFLAAIKGGEALEAAQGQANSLQKTLLTCMALTWLNPHVYLDTVILLGSVSSGYESRWAFGLGAVLASFTFFFLLGYGARLLAPLFAKPIAWRVLDMVVGLTMWLIAWMLLLD